LAKFQCAILEKVEQLIPPNCKEGRYHLCGAESAHVYFCDTISKDIQKFNECLRKVYLSKPTGAGDEEKVNMAVAMHLGNINRMDYHFKIFDSSRWRFIGAWKVLRDIPSSRFLVQAVEGFKRKKMREKKKAKITNSIPFIERIRRNSVANHPQACHQSC